MRFLALIAFCFAIFSVRAADVSIAWNSSTNYTHRIYASTNGLPSTNAVIVDVGTNTAATLYQLKPGRYSFAVTALASEGIESDLSSVILADVPDAPTEFRIVLMNSGTVDGPYKDLGFFKMRIEQIAP